MKQYGYFQETAESITDDNWAMTLEKHGNQGWELCSVTVQDTYKKLGNKKDVEKADAENVNRQTIFIAIFKREL